MNTVQEAEPSRTFVLTVDVEIDAGRKWKTSNPATYEGVKIGIKKLQTLCLFYGVKPVYFLSPAVLVDQDSIEILRTLDPAHCELGAHLHGEYIEPFAKYAGPDFSGCDPGEMQCEYERDVEFLKLKNLTEKFTELFGYPPRSFRAGRFGARGWTIECLEQLGYTHDSSVTPFRNWHDIADFSAPGSLSPYHPSPLNICEEGGTAVLEVPVSITPQLEWLRPTPKKFSNFDQIKRVIGWYEEHATPTVLCCMFHNVELVPGKSPYCKTEKDCQEMLYTIEAMFDFLQGRGYQFKKLSDVTTVG